MGRGRDQARGKRTRGPNQIQKVALRQKGLVKASSYTVMGSVNIHHKRKAEIGKCKGWRVRKSLLKRRKCVILFGSPTLQSDCRGGGQSLPRLPSTIRQFPKSSALCQAGQGSSNNSEFRNVLPIVTKDDVSGARDCLSLAYVS